MKEKIQKWDKHRFSISEKKKKRIENNRSFCRDEKRHKPLVLSPEYPEKKLKKPDILSWNFITLDIKKKKKLPKMSWGKKVGSLLMRRASNSHHLWLMVKGKGHKTLNLGRLRRKWGRKGKKKGRKDIFRHTDRRKIISCLPTLL